MDFVEHLFHVSPDGGNGLYEAAIVCATVLTASALRIWRKRMPRGRLRRTR